MTSGEVALYVLALLSSCQNPRHVHALGQTIDLVQVLQEKTDEEMASLGMPAREGWPGVPGMEAPPSPCLGRPSARHILLCRLGGRPEDHPVQRQPGRPGPVPGRSRWLPRGIRDPGQEGADARETTLCG